MRFLQTLVPQRHPGASHPTGPTLPDGVCPGSPSTQPYLGVVTPFRGSPRVLLLLAPFFLALPASGTTWPHDPRAGRGDPDPSWVHSRTSGSPSRIRELTFSRARAPYQGLLSYPSGLPAPSTLDSLQGSPGCLPLGGTLPSDGRPSTSISRQRPSPTPSSLLEKLTGLLPPTSNPRGCVVRNPCSRHPLPFQLPQL